MELTVRLITSSLAQPLPELGATASDGRGLAVGALCAGLFLAFGIAHYAGFAKLLADAFVFSPYLGLATGWLGGGALLMIVAARVIPADGPLALTLLGLALGFVAAIAWVVGLVGIFWIPQRLRPRWLRERLSQRPATGRRGSGRGRLT